MSTRKLSNISAAQPHIDPVPEFIVKQVLRHLKMDKATFLKEFDNK